MAATSKRAGRPAPPGTRHLSEIAADNIRTYRYARRLSQAQLADRMAAVGHGWVRVTVSEVERCGRNVTIDELGALADALDVSVMDILDPTAFPPRRAGAS